MANEVKEPALKYNYITPAEYLLAERASEEKHEYYDGQVLAMGGASLKHVRINRNIISKTDSYLKDKNCEVLPEGIRVSTKTQDAYMYPDALIVCGAPEMEDEKFDTLLNPTVIFEILSPSTTNVDKGRKLFFYQRIQSLQEYIMIDSLKKFIQLARKQPDGAWMFEDISHPEAALFIRTIDFHLPLQEIYTDTGL
jgi:Uma2 family endonuclease